MFQLIPGASSMRVTPLSVWVAVFAKVNRFLAKNIIKKGSMMSQKLFFYILPNRKTL